MLEDVVQALREDIQSHFDNSNIQLTEDFSLRDLTNRHYFNMNEIAVFLCNLECRETMNEVAHGNYDVFDPYDEVQFNDSYWSLVEQLEAI